jgi:hypothetical protein
MRNMKNSLPPGDWMLRNDVLDYLSITVCKPALSDIIETLCTPHIVGGDAYYSCKQLRSYIYSQLYKEMECKVSTLMVGPMTIYRTHTWAGIK